MPTIGLSTYSLFLKTGYLQALQFAIDHGFKGVEIWSNVFDFAPGFVTQQEIESIREIADKNGISLAIHFCSSGNDLAQTNVGHLAESRRQLKETIRICSEIGGKVVIIHPGQEPRLSIHSKNSLSQYPNLQLETLKKDAIARFKDSLSEAAHCAEEHGVVVGLENFSHVKGCIQSTYEELVEWVDEIGSPGLKITLDMGHANLEGGVEKAIEIFGSRIVHVHLNDNDAKSSAHGELGTGTIGWQAIVPFFRSFDGMLSLEVLGFDDVDGAVLRSKALLEGLLKETH